MRRKVKITIGAAAMAMGILCGVGGGKLLQVMAAPAHEVPNAYTRSYEDTSYEDTSVQPAMVEEL